LAGAVRMSCGDVLDRDRRAGQHGAGRVGHATDDVGGSDLRAGRGGGREREAEGEDAGGPADTNHTLLLQ
jgi:hypothetical protein